MLTIEALWSSLGKQWRLFGPQLRVKQQGDAGLK
jgi:hypothetical protein